MEHGRTCAVRGGSPTERKEMLRESEGDLREQSPAGAGGGRKEEGSSEMQGRSTASRMLKQR